MGAENKRVGVVGVPGGWSSELLADHLERRTGFRCLIDMERVACDMSTGEVRCGELRLDSLDALLIKKAGPDYAPSLLDRLEILRLLAERGLPVFSDPCRILRVLNRLSCTVTLELGGIPIPPTCVTEDLDEAARAVEEYGEAVLKPLYTSKGRGMRTVRAGRETRASLKEFQEAGNKVLYVQKLMQVPDRDLGIVFLGGEYLGTYARVRKRGSWNTTTANGGTYAACRPTAEYVSLAQRAQDLFRLDFTCVDLAETPQGPVVFEVSAFGGFRGLATAGIDAAAAYADYVLGEL
jgi:ribosomal protein S6--L-glutamate ligase